MIPIVISQHSTLSESIRPGLSIPGRWEVLQRQHLFQPIGLCTGRVVDWSSGIVVNTVVGQWFSSGFFKAGFKSQYDAMIRVGSWFNMSCNMLQPW